MRASLTLLPAVAPPGGHPLGNQRPALWSFPPWASSAAGEAIDLAEGAGVVLDPWQRWGLYPSMGERPDGKWAAGDVKWTVCRQNGKGGVIEVRELAGLYLFAEELIIHTAHLFKTAQEAFSRLLALVEGCPDLDRKVMRVPQSHGEEGIELIPTPTVITGSGFKDITRSRRARVRFLARTKGSGRGFSADLLVYDEDMFLGSEDVGASRPTLSARRLVTPAGPQVWYMGSAGMRVSTQAARLRARALAPVSRMLDGRDVSDAEMAELQAAYAATLPADVPESYAGGLPGTDNRLVYLDWCIEPHREDCDPDCTRHDDPYTEAAVIKSNPAYGIRIFGDEVADERASMGEEEYLRERLGVGTYPNPGDAWLIVPRAWWERSQMAAGDTHRPAQRVMAVDASPGRGWASIGACGPRPDGRLQAALVDRRRGTGWVVGRCRDLDAEVSPVCWVIDPAAAAGELIPDLADAGLTVVTPTAREIGHACGGLYDAFSGDQIRHPGDAPVRRALAGAEKRRIGGQWAFDRPDGDLDVSPLYTWALGLWGWRRHGEAAQYDVRRSVMFDVRELVRLLSAGVYGQGDVERVWSRGLLSAEDLTTIEAAGFALPFGVLAGRGEA